MATVSFEPVGGGVEVNGEAWKLAHWLIVSIRRNGHKVGRATDVDAGCVGVGDRQCGSGLARREADVTSTLCKGLLHRSVARMAPHRVRRLAHSLKRDIGPAATNRHAGSPMSMTSPRTTLSRGHCAPLPDRSSAAPLTSVRQPRPSVFRRRDLRQWADYYAHTSLDKTSFRGSLQYTQDTRSGWSPSIASTLAGGGVAGRQSTLSGVQHWSVTSVIVRIATARAPA